MFSFQTPLVPEERNLDGTIRMLTDKMRDDMVTIMTKLRKVGLVLQRYLSQDGDEILVEIGAHQEWLEVKATEIRLSVKTKPSWQYSVWSEEDKTEEAPGGNGPSSSNAVDLKKSRKACWRKLDSVYIPFNLSNANDYLGLYGLLSSAFRFRTKEAMFIIRKTIEMPSATAGRDVVSRGQGGCDLNMPRLKEDGIVLEFFALHGPSLTKLLNSWGSWNMIIELHEQPINDVRDYFGERVAMYFSFLGYMTQELYLPAIVGIFAMILTVVFPRSDMVVMVHSCFLVCWMCWFCQRWLQVETINALRWGTIGYNRGEEPRPLFDGKYDKETDTIQHADRLIYQAKCATAFYISLAYTGMVGVAMVLILWMRNILQNCCGLGSVANIVNAIAIGVFDAIYRELGVELTDWENHRTQSAWEDSHVTKSFLFQFVNRYLALFVTAFVMPFPESRVIFGTCPCLEWKGPSMGTAMHNSSSICNEDQVYPTQIDGCECTRRNCIGMTGQLMLSIFLVNLFVQNTMEILGPMAMAKFKQWMEGLDDDFDEDARDPTRLDGGYDQRQFEERGYSVAEEEKMMEVYGDVEIFDDYAELVIQLGYVGFFALAFPVAATLALLNNLVEIRGDAFKLCTAYQRPHARRAENIGAWYLILNIMSVITITTNAGYACFFTYTFNAHFDLHVRVWAFFLIEHGFFFLRAQLMIYYPEYTPATQLAIDKEMSTQKRAHDESHCDLMERTYGEELKKVMDSYEYDSSDEEDWMASKPELYSDCRYQLNMGMAMRRSHGIKKTDVPITYCPGEMSFDKRFKNNVEAEQGAPQ